MWFLAAGLGLVVATGWSLQESFTDTVFPPSGWSVVNVDSGTRVWQRLDIGYRTEPGCAYCGWEGYYRRNYDWLITPQCSVVTGDRFSFWVRAQDEAFHESLEVWVSTLSPRLPDFQQIDAFGTSSISYQFRECDLSQFIGQKLFLALVYRSWNKYGVMVDDVTGPSEWEPVHDVGVTAINLPPRYLRVGTCFRPTCRVRNWTSSSEWVRVSYEIPGVWREDTGLALAPMESVLVSFPELTIWQPDTYQVIFVTHLGCDQRWWNDTLQQPVAVYPFQSRGGPDSLGYVWFDSDDPQGPEFDWLELYPSGTLLGWGDDSLFRMDLVWPFHYYGRDYSILWVCTNGWLAFGPPSPGSPSDSNIPIPFNLAPNRLVAPFWDDLWVKGNEGGIWFQDFGDTLLVIEWRHTRRKGCPKCSLNFEAKLFRSGGIEFHYQSVDAGDERFDGGMSATVGIEDHSGRVGLQSLYNGVPPGNLLAKNRAIRFVQLPPGIADEQFSPATDCCFSIWPNPAAEGVTIRFTVPYACPVRLKVCDASGRVVRTLQERVLGQGLHTASWNGADERGQQVSSGIYFCCLNMPEYSETKKILLVR